jgi:peptidoglycan-N-acetylglucosamine deacetylase
MNAAMSRARAAGWSVLAGIAMAFSTLGAHAETPPEVESAPLLKPSMPSAGPALDCARGGQTWGVSRVVEIDTESGPEFGDQYHASETKFLEPGEVVLTFDDGPMRRYTMPILDALDEHCVKATFFSVGRMAIADPATLQEVARRGHTIGVHTWSHQKLSTLGSAAMKREFELGLSAVAAAAGTPVAPFFRFPYLGHNRPSLTYIRERGMGIFGIHVDSRDFRTKSPGVVLRNVMSQLERERKGILLFHDIQPSTAGAIGSLIDELKEHGYKIVHVVPKNPAVTLPEYDAMAARMLKAKSVAATNALATRAATWPASDPPAETAESGTPEPVRKPSAVRPPSHTSKPFDWANPSNDPWQLKSFGHQ